MVYYPGSSRQRREYVEPEPVVKEPEDDLPDLGTPKYYMVGNSPVALYRIGAIAAALNRKSGTIRKWEREGFIPVSPYKMPSHDNRGQRRLYSKQQIETLRRIALEEGILYPDEGGRWKAVEKTNFKARAANAFSI